MMKPVTNLFKFRNHNLSFDLLWYWTLFTTFLKESETWSLRVIKLNDIYIYITKAAVNANQWVNESMSLRPNINTVWTRAAWVTSINQSASIQA